MAWLTNKDTGGVFNTDWLEEEKTKNKQIAANKAEADTRNVKQSGGIKHITADEFNREAKRQGLNLTSDDIEDYVTSSYGGVGLGDKISKFVDNAPEYMHVHSDKSAYRGLSFNSKQEMDNFIKSHQIGKNLETRRDGLSWSMSENVAKAFSTDNTKNSVILVNEDERRNAISIKGFADTPGISSEEILYSSSTDFQVVDVENRNGITYMYVTEAPVLRKKYK